MDTTHNTIKVKLNTKGHINYYQINLTNKTDLLTDNHNQAVLYHPRIPKFNEKPHSTNLAQSIYTWAPPSPQKTHTMHVYPSTDNYSYSQKMLLLSFPSIEVATLDLW